MLGTCLVLKYLIGKTKTKSDGVLPQNREDA